VVKLAVFDFSSNKRELGSMEGALFGRMTALRTLRHAGILTNRLNDFEIAIAFWAIVVVSRHWLFGDLQMETT
jgi:hypothetical protein